MGKFSTKDLELSEKLQAKGCTIKNITQDPTDQMLIHTFHETEGEVSKILKTESKKETVQEKAEVLPEVKKKVGRPKKKRRKKK